MTQTQEISNLNKIRLLAQSKETFEKANQAFNSIFYNGGYAEKKALVKILEELLEEYESGLLVIDIQEAERLQLHLNIFKYELDSQQKEVDRLRKVRSCAYQINLERYKQYFPTIGQLSDHELDVLISEFKIKIKHDSFPFEFKQWTQEAIRLVDSYLKAGKNYEEIADIINQYDRSMKVGCVESFLEPGSLEFVEQQVEPYHLEKVEKRMALKHKTPYERYRSV